LLADLGVVKTHSRPHVSDDNPYSESQFRTLKYRPGFPDRFGSIEDARGFCQSFFQWYKHQHHHSGLGLMTPAMVHHGQAAHILAHRQVVLNAAYSAHSQRFRPQTAPSTGAALPGLDQQAPCGGKNSLNFHAVCLIVVDTHGLNDTQGRPRIGHSRPSTIGHVRNSKVAGPKDLCPTSPAQCK